MIQCYTHTSDSSIEEIDDFYDHLDEAMQHCKARVLKIVMGASMLKLGRTKMAKLLIHLVWVREMNEVKG